MPFLPYPLTAYALVAYGFCWLMASYALCLLAYGLRLLLAYPPSSVVPSYPRTVVPFCLVAFGLRLLLAYGFCCLVAYVLVAFSLWLMAFLGLCLFGRPQAQKSPFSHRKIEHFTPSAVFL